MRHLSYWGASIASATAGAAIVVTRYAFSGSDRTWIIFGLAVAAVACSLAGAAAALRRDQGFSGTSAVAALAAAVIVLTNRAVATPSALSIAVVAAIVVLAASLRALSLHESTVEEVVHRLAIDSSGASTAAVRRQDAPATESYPYLSFLTSMGVGLVGTFAIVSSFVWPHATAGLSVRWLDFGIGVLAASIAIIGLIGRIGSRDRSLPSLISSSLTLLAGLGGGGIVAVTLATTNAYDTRWWTFALGAGLAGVALVASLIHELTTERVRHQLEVGHPVSEQELV
jgi:hypothetical protein